MVRIISGKGITFAVSNTSSTSPPIVQPASRRACTQVSYSWQTPTKRPPCLAVTVIPANRKSELLTTTFPIPIDTVRRQRTTRRIQSSADFLSIEGRRRARLLIPVVPFGQQWQKGDSN